MTRAIQPEPGAASWVRTSTGTQEVVIGGWRAGEAGAAVADQVWASRSRWAAGRSVPASANELAASEMLAPLHTDSPLRLATARA